MIRAQKLLHRDRVSGLVRMKPSFYSSILGAYEACSALELCVLDRYADRFELIMPCALQLSHEKCSCTFHHSSVSCPFTWGNFVWLPPGDFGVAYD